MVSDFPLSPTLPVFAHQDTEQVEVIRKKLEMVENQPTPIDLIAENATAVPCAVKKYLNL